MIVTCPNCQTRYNLPDDKVPPGGAKVKCSKCAHVFKAELPPPVMPEEEVVESLLEEEAATPDTGAGDAFDETFDEVASDSTEKPDSQPSTDPETEMRGDLPDYREDDSDDHPENGTPEPTAETPPPAGDDLSDMDDLFDDEIPDDEATPEPSAPVPDTTNEDVESLFGNDESDLFADETDEDDEGDPADDLFPEDDETISDDDDLFASDKDDEKGDTPTDFGLDEQPVKKKKDKKAIGCLTLVLVATILIGAGLYFKAWTWFGLDLGASLQNVPYIGSLFMEKTEDGDAAPGESPAERVRKIELKNVKQYYVTNEKAGTLFIVEGKAVNKFTTVKEQIKVDVVLYDATGGVLASQAFLCGNVLSQFQLQVQTQKEIEEGLASEVGILSNNTFLRPGSSTPFMAVFFAPPQGVKEFLVKVVDVKDPE